MFGTVNPRELSARSSMVSTLATRHLLSFVYVFLQLLFSLVTDLAIRAKRTGWQADIFEIFTPGILAQRMFADYYHMHVI
jgi:hypothetical protein